MPSSSSVSVPASLKEGLLLSDVDTEAAADTDDEAIDELEPFDCKTPSTDEGSIAIEADSSSEAAGSRGSAASLDADNEDFLGSAWLFSSSDSAGGLRDISRRASII